MEKYPRRETVLLGYSPQISFGNPASSSPRVPDGNSDIDFNDVFGGPPRRRSSITESRYSLNETADSLTSKEDGEPVVGRNLWSGLSEKPVFGEEPNYGRRHPGDKFFDDIFKCEESGVSTPKRHDRDPFSPISSSRVLSPVRPLPAMAETFGSPSLPAQFSLPARVVRGIDFSSFGSATHSTKKNKDAAFNGVNRSNSPSLPRLSSLLSQAQEDIKHEIQSFDGSTLSAQELTQSGEELSKQERSDGTKTGGNLEKVLNSSEDSTNESQFPFHFSIYKWANKEVPFGMPPTREHISRSKQTAKTRRCSSSNGRMVTEKNAKHSPSSTLHDSDRPSSDHPLTSNDSVKVIPGIEIDSFLGETNQQRKEPSQIIEEPILPNPESERMSSNQKTVDRALLHHSRREAKYNSFTKVGDSVSEESNQHKQRQSQVVEEPIFSEAESEKANRVQETVDYAPLKSSTREAKFSSFIDKGFSEKTEKEPPEFTKGAAKETLILGGGSESKSKSSRRSYLSVNNNNFSKKEDEEATMIRKMEVEKSSSQSSSTNPGLGDGGKRGKVKEFVKIFNQELSSTSKVDMDNHSQSSKQKQRCNSGTGIEVDDTTPIAGKSSWKVIDNTVSNVKNNTSANVSIKVDDHSKHSSKEQPAVYSEQNSPTLSSESIPEDSSFTVVDIDESFQENFLIKELPQDEMEQPQMQNDREEIKAIDAKIREWSRGKEGNIRSLLSTLQYVLWAESGWKSVALVDIIDGNAVKRSYQRALLCLHPDKLQQRGVTSHQKYTAQKVFDILQEAWTFFSSLGPL